MKCVHQHRRHIVKGKAVIGSVLVCSTREPHTGLELIITLIMNHFLNIMTSYRSHLIMIDVSVS